MIAQIVDAYKQFMIRQGWNQREAAEAVGCSRQHINRIINNVCTPSAALCAKMEAVMGQPKDFSLEACKKAYPLGNVFIQFYDSPDGSPAEKDYRDCCWLGEPFTYETEDDGACLSFMVYSPTNKIFRSIEVVFWKITGYITFDGYTFSPTINLEPYTTAFDSLATKYVYVQNPYTNCPFTLESLKNFANENIIAYNNIHGTDYISLFSEEECAKILEATND